MAGLMMGLLYVLLAHLLLVLGSSGTPLMANSPSSMVMI